MKGRIRTALTGVGNCASILLQGLRHYGEDDSRAGLWHKTVGGYRVGDVDVVEAFDVDGSKVGLDLAEAIFKEPNVAPKRVALSQTGVIVRGGLMLDHPPDSLKDAVLSTSKGAEDIVEALEASDANVVVNTISSGLDASSKAYAEAALKAGASFINATPSTLACDEKLVAAFTKAKSVIVGDDLMSQFGGTAFHKGLLDFIDRRGVRVSKSYQLDVGGGAETLNTLDEELKAIKRDMKTRSIIQELPYSFETVAGTTEYVDYMGNQRTSYFWFEGNIFLEEPVKIDIYLRTMDAANAGNILLDTIRATQLATEKGEFGAPQEICGYGFKKTLRHFKTDEAYNAFASKYLT